MPSPACSTTEGRRPWGLPMGGPARGGVPSALGGSGQVAVLAEPAPDSIADALARLLDDREEAAAMARRARAWVEDRTWQRAGDQVEQALRDFLSNPRSSEAVRA